MKEKQGKCLLLPCPPPPALSKGKNRKCPLPSTHFGDGDPWPKLNSITFRTGSLDCVHNGWSSFLGFSENRQASSTAGLQLCFFFPFPFFFFSTFSRGSLFLISLERQLLIRMDRRVFALALFSVSIESLL